jgi:hypothetical protein
MDCCKGAEPLSGKMVCKLTLKPINSHKSLTTIWRLDPIPVSEEKLSFYVRNMYNISDDRKQTNEQHNCKNNEAYQQSPDRGALFFAGMYGNGQPGCC